VQQWEYLDLMVLSADWADSQGRSGKLTEFPVEGRDEYWTVGPLLNQLGAEGWELVGFQGGRLILKRPKQ
jgi:hypothetical protein